MRYDKTLYYVVLTLLLLFSSYAFLYNFLNIGAYCDRMTIQPLVAKVLFSLSNWTLGLALLLLNVAAGFGLHCLTAYRKHNRWWEYIVFVAVLGWTLYVLYYVWFVTPWD